MKYTPNRTKMNDTNDPSTRSILVIALRSPLTVFSDCCVQRPPDPTRLCLLRRADGQWRATGYRHNAAIARMTTAPRKDRQLIAHRSASGVDGSTGGAFGLGDQLRMWLAMFRSHRGRHPSGPCGRDSNCKRRTTAHRRLPRSPHFLRNASPADIAWTPAVCGLRIRAARTAPAGWSSAPSQPSRY
jgi:hypothetical protein